MSGLKYFIGRLKTAFLLTGMTLFIAMVSFPFSLKAQEKKKPSSTCIAMLQNPKVKNIDCNLNFNLDKRTQKSMQVSTAGMIKNAACIAKISVTRKEIFTALRNEKVMQVPRQPVHCNIHVLGDSVLAKFHMAPKIRFKGGKAVQARPGMSDVIGMPEILATLLTDWVNSSEAIESAMLDEVNKSLELIRPPALKK